MKTEKILEANSQSQVLDLRWKWFWNIKKYIELELRYYKSEAEKVSQLYISNPPQ